MDTLSHRNKPPSNPQIENLVWTKPAREWFKLNIDGSVKGKHLAAGGIIWSEKGEWTLGYTNFVGIGTPLLAEAWALYLGLKFTINIGIKIVEI